MKKTYINPNMQVILFTVSTQMLAGSFTDNTTGVKFSTHGDSVEQMDGHGFDFDDEE